MANGYFSVSSGQAAALLKFMKEKLPASIDETVKMVGQEDAFKLHTLRERLERHEAKQES